MAKSKPSSLRGGCGSAEGSGLTWHVGGGKPSTLLCEDVSSHNKLLARAVKVA